MPRKLPSRKRVDGLFTILKALDDRSGSPPESGSSPKANELRKKISRTLAKPLEMAFRKAGLDAGKRDDRDRLLVWLAWGIYGGKSPGAPKKWTPKRLRQLLDDVNMLKAKRDLNDGDCCKQLSKGLAANGRYKEMNSSTLRRVLQQAKALSAQTQLFTAPVQDILAAGPATKPKSG